MLRSVRSLSTQFQDVSKRIKIFHEKMWEIPYKMRLLKSEDIPQLIELKRAQGSHDVLSSIYTWHRMDPEGISVAVTDNGQLIGVLATLRFHEEFYFGSLFYVAKGYRKSGVGLELYNERLGRTKGYNLGCNAVPGLKEVFEKDLHAFEHRWVMNIYETFKKVKPEHLSGVVPEGVEIHPFQNCHLKYMHAYDTELMGYQREFLEWSCHENDSKTFVAFKKVAGLLECVGFGTIKESCLGSGRVGPLYADDPQVAEVILKKLLMSKPHLHGFAMMGLSSNDNANRLMEKIGCPNIKKYDRMFKLWPLNVDSRKVYAVFDMNTVAY